jgi:hypothetical protein
MSNGRREERREEKRMRIKNQKSKYLPYLAWDM